MCKIHYQRAYHRTLLWLAFIFISIQSASAKEPQPGDTNGIYTEAIVEAKRWHVEASMSVSMTAQQFVNVLNRSPHDCTWLQNCKSVHLLATPSENSQIIATRFDSPWPLNDRIMITRVVVTFSNDGRSVIVSIDSKGLSNSSLLNESGAIGPESAPYVLVNKPSGVWKLSSTVNGHNILSYKGSAEKDRGFPLFLLLRHLRHSTLSTFQNLRKLDEYYAQTQ
ncbi:hypothetical protein ISG33_06130 [Glaciecola sp. MH2013]|uniref:hypothetical protein n=1 Tax=Glaciecola sp. MH2013 TaxID=2785524 RepID=UPI00189CB5CE|nr:hypothetical protein [Glaciecola sp. MH2013]MBF7072975.1 hypothetical protein [Glaciecola sp. MH2013]